MDYVDTDVAIFTGFDEEAAITGLPDGHDCFPAITAMFRRMTNPHQQRAVINLDGEHVEISFMFFPPSIWKELEQKTPHCLLLEAAIVGECDFLGQDGCWECSALPTAGSHVPQRQACRHNSC